MEGTAETGVPVIPNSRPAWSSIVIISAFGIFFTFKRKILFLSITMSIGLTGREIFITNLKCKPSIHMALSLGYY